MFWVRTVGFTNSDSLWHHSEHVTPTALSPGTRHNWKLINRPIRNKQRGCVMGIYYIIYNIIKCEIYTRTHEMLHIVIITPEIKLWKLRFSFIVWICIRFGVNKYEMLSLSIFTPQSSFWADSACRSWTVSSLPPARDHWRRAAYKTRWTVCSTQPRWSADCCSETSPPSGRTKQPA